MRWPRLFVFLVPLDPCENDDDADEKMNEVRIHDISAIEAEVLIRRARAHDFLDVVGINGDHDEQNKHDDDVVNDGIDG